MGGPDPAAIKRFLAIKEREKAEKLRAEKLKKLNLLQLRAQNSKSKKVAKMMASRTKDNDFSKIKVSIDDLQQRKIVEEELRRQRISNPVERMKQRIELESVDNQTKKRRKKMYQAILDDLPTGNVEDSGVWSKPSNKSSYLNSNLPSKSRKLLEYLEKAKVEKGERKASESKSQNSSSFPYSMKIPKLSVVKGKYEPKEALKKHPEEYSPTRPDLTPGYQPYFKSEYKSNSLTEYKPTKINVLQTSQTSKAISQSKIAEAKLSSKIDKKVSHNSKPSISRPNPGTRKDINTYLQQTKLREKIKEEAQLEEKLRAERIMKHLKQVEERNKADKKRQEMLSSKSRHSSKLLEKELKSKKNLKSEPSLKKMGICDSEKHLSDYNKDDNLRKMLLKNKESRDRVDSKNKQKLASNGKTSNAQNRTELLSHKDKVKSSSIKAASKLIPSSSACEAKKLNKVKDINHDSYKKRPIMSRYSEQDRYEERVKSKRPMPSNRILPPIGLTYKRSMNDRYMYSDNEEKDDEDEDEEMNDFIDDGDDLESQKEDVSKFIREIFGYDKRKYSHLDDDDIEESSFAQQMREEVRSAKIGLMEDLEDIRKEEEEKKRKQMKRKRARVIDDDDDDDY